MQSDFLMTLAKRCKTYPINTTTAENAILFATPAGKFFTVYHVHIEAEANQSVLFLSEGTALSGPINIAANASLDLCNGGVPVFRGRTVGDDFKMTTSAGEQINGFFVVVEGDV